MMGKEQYKDNASRTYVLKVTMHCQCNGCIKKINDGANEITLSEEVERADLVVEAAEVTVVGTVDTEKLCCLLHELTQKPVKIEAQTAMSQEDAAASKQTKNRVGQAPETPRRQYSVTPSAPPLPEAWRTLTAPSERCARTAGRRLLPACGLHPTSRVHWRRMSSESLNFEGVNKHRRTSTR